MDPNQRRKDQDSRLAQTNHKNDRCFFWHFHDNTSKSSEIFGQQYPFLGTSNPELEEAYLNWSSRDNVIREERASREHELRAWPIIARLIKPFLGTREKKGPRKKNRQLLCQSSLFLFLDHPSQCPILRLTSSFFFFILLSSSSSLSFFLFQIPYVSQFLSKKNIPTFSLRWYFMI